MRILKKILSAVFTLCMLIFVLFLLLVPSKGGRIPKKDLSNCQIYIVTPEQGDKNFYDTKYGIPVESDTLERQIKEYLTTLKPMVEIGTILGDLPHYRIVLDNGVTRYIVYLGYIYPNKEPVLNSRVYITKAGTGYKNNWFWIAAASDTMIHEHIFDTIKDFEGDAVQLP